MAGLIPSDKLEEIRAANDIVEVIRSYLPLRKQGGGFVALCPFHREKTPSFHVNPARQIFHCFGCHQGGDVFRFVQEYERLSFVEAVRRLAERAHIRLEFEQGDRPAGERDLRDRLRDLHERLTQHWHRILTVAPEGQPARDYLKQRGVPAEAVKRFRLGYAPPGWEATIEWARRERIDLRLLEQGGLVIKREGGPGAYDRFRGRLMFPIADVQGRVIGFSGRVIEGDEKSAKYINSPETPLFQKGRVIYALDRARRALLDAGEAVICEGQLDVIACHMAGIETAVAPQGTALTADQCRILKRFVESVVLCFDSDTAGQKAAIRAVDDLLASGLGIRVAVIPAPHDPDSFIRTEGAEAFRDLIDEARDFFDFLLDHLCTVHDPESDRGRVAIVEGMAEQVAKAPSPVVREGAIRRVAARLGLSPDTVREVFGRRARRARPAVETGEAAATELEEEPPSGKEFWLVRLLLSHPELAPWAADNLQPEWIRHRRVRDIVTEWLRLLEEDDGEALPSVPALLNRLPEEKTRHLVTEAAVLDRDIPQATAQLVDVVARIEEQHLDERLRLNKQKLAAAEASDMELVRALTEENLQLLRRKRELQAQYSTAAGRRP